MWSKWNLFLVCARVWWGCRWMCERHWPSDCWFICVPNLFVMLSVGLVEFAQCVIRDVGQASVYWSLIGSDRSIADDIIHRIPVARQRRTWLTGASQHLFLWTGSAGLSHHGNREPGIPQMQTLHSDSYSVNNPEPRQCVLVSKLDLYFYFCIFCLQFSHFV